MGGWAEGQACASSWVKIRMQTENQLPGLSGSALKVGVGVEWVVQLITLSLSTWVEVELRLWQYFYDKIYIDLLKIHDVAKCSTLRRLIIRIHTCALCFNQLRNPGGSNIYEVHQLWFLLEEFSIRRNAIVSINATPKEATQSFQKGNLQWHSIKKKIIR